MTLPDDFFRVLDEEEGKQFRQWARDNWSIWHPTVRDEIKKIVLEDFASSEDMLDALQERWGSE